MKTNITVHKIYLAKPESTFRKATASINFDGLFAVHGIAVIEGKDKQLRIGMPNRKLKNGKYVDVAHPITKECRDYITEIVLEAYEKALEEQAQEG